MRNMTRGLAMGAMALVAGATFSVTGATAAQAAPAAAKASVTAATQELGSQRSVEQRRDRWRYVRSYRTYRACNRAGWIGDDRGWWDDYRCERTRRGVALLVRDDDRGRDHRGRDHDHDRDRDRGHDGRRGRDHDRDHDGRGGRHRGGRN